MAVLLLKLWLASQGSCDLHGKKEASGFFMIVLSSAIWGLNDPEFQDCRIHEHPLALDNSKASYVSEWMVFLFLEFHASRLIWCILRKIVRVGEKSVPFSGDKKGEEICMKGRILNEVGKDGGGCSKEEGIQCDTQSSKLSIPEKWVHVYQHVLRLTFLAYFWSAKPSYKASLFSLRGTLV